MLLIIPLQDSRAWGDPLSYCFFFKEQSKICMFDLTKVQDKKAAKRHILDIFVREITWKGNR